RLQPRRKDNQSHPARRAALAPALSDAPDISQRAHQSGLPPGAKRCSWSPCSDCWGSYHQLPCPCFGGHIHFFLADAARSIAAQSPGFSHYQHSVSSIVTIPGDVSILAFKFKPCIAVPHSDEFLA